MRRLWLEVLAVGILDAAQGHEPEWIGSPDFRFVCDQAGLVPEVVALRFQRHRDELAAAIGYRSNGTRRRLNTRCSA